MFGVRAEGRGAPSPASHSAEAALHPLYQTKLTACDAGGVTDLM